MCAMFCLFICVCDLSFYVCVVFCPFTCVWCFVFLHVCCFVCLHVCGVLSFYMCMVFCLFTCVCGVLSFYMCMVFCLFTCVWCFVSLHVCGVLSLYVCVVFCLFVCVQMSSHILLLSLFCKFVVVVVRSHWGESKLQHTDNNYKRPPHPTPTRPCLPVKKICTLLSFSLSCFYCIWWHALKTTELEASELLFSRMSFSVKMFEYI